MKPFSMKIYSGDLKIAYSARSKNFIVSEEVTGSYYSQIADDSERRASLQ